MEQQGRTLLAVALSMAVVFGYSYFFAPKPAELAPAATQVAATQAPTPEVVKSQSGSPAQLTAPIAVQKPEAFYTVENQTVKATFSSQGGTLKSWILKDYHVTTESTSPPIDLMDAGHPGLSVSWDSQQAPEMGYFEKVSQTENSLVLKGVENGLIVTKTFVLGSNLPHVLDVQMTLENPAGDIRNVTPHVWISKIQKDTANQSGFLAFLQGGTLDIFHPIRLLDGTYHADMNWEKLPAQTTHQGSMLWAGLTDRYFLLSGLARQQGVVSQVYGRAGSVLSSAFSYGEVRLAAGEKKEIPYSFYIGPKKREELKQLGMGLEKSVDYGWFGFVAIPILWLLIFFQNLIGNWGLAIIALTFFIKLLLHPVNKKALESMKGMQKLQPHLQSIREKYKDDKQKLNLEMMQLFKTHKINPMGGCLPMLLQFPIYIALYKVLWNAIELYHAPFFGFYKDLAAPDPYFITPVLLGVFMVLQQKFTPQAATMDPAQQKIMMFMPIMFVGFMFFLPFGLVLYILVNTVMSVVQQLMVQHDLSFRDLFRKRAK